ncbi:MAG: 4'-phosphopantetheinyl transferase family protein [Paracoccaceae bacterium]
MPYINSIFSNNIFYSISLKSDVKGPDSLPNELIRGLPVTEERLAAYGLLDRILATNFSASINDLTKDDLGCPRCKSEFKCWVSIAHSGNFVAASASALGPVGIDLESFYSWDTTIEDIVLTAQEKNYIDTTNHRARAGTRFWVRKEALGKALGIGIDDSVLKSSTENISLTVEGKTFFLRDLNAPVEYCAALSFAFF